MSEEIVKERLLEILKNNAGCDSLGIESCETCPYKYEDHCYTHALVEHLMKHGVIVCPVPIGSYVYEVRYSNKECTEGFICRRLVAGMHLYDEKSRRGLRRGQYMVLRSETGYSAHVNINQIGKTIFVTEEEAKIKLNGGNQ